MNIESIILQDLFEFSAEGPITEGQKVRELQLSNGLQPWITEQNANEPQKLEYLRGPRIYKVLTSLIQFKKLVHTLLEPELE